MAHTATTADPVDAFQRNLCSDVVPDGLMLATQEGYVIGVHYDAPRCLEWIALTARGAFRHAEWKGVLMLEFELFDDALLTCLRWGTRPVPGGVAAEAPSAAPWLAGERDGAIRAREVERAGLRAIDTAVELGLFEQAPRAPSIVVAPSADIHTVNAADAPSDGDDVILRMQADMAAVVAMAARAREGATA